MHDRDRQVLDRAGRGAADRRRSRAPSRARARPRRVAPAPSALRATAPRLRGSRDLVEADEERRLAAGELVRVGVADTARTTRRRPGGRASPRPRRGRARASTWTRGRSPRAARPRSRGALARPELEHLARPAQRLAHRRGARRRARASRVAARAGSRPLGDRRAPPSRRPRSRRAGDPPRRSPSPRARARAARASATSSGGASSSSASDPSPKSSSPRAAHARLAVAPVVEDGERLRRVEVVVERRLEARPTRSAAGRARRAEDALRNASTLRPRLLERLVGEVDRLAPVRRHEEEEQRLAAPRVEHVAERDDRCRATSTSSRRRSSSIPLCIQTRANSWPSARDCASSFSWCGKTRSSPPPWISNAGPRMLLRHRRALDVPARPARAPTASPTTVSSPGLFAFQSAKSRGSSFSGFGSCSSTWSGRWPREPAVVRDRSRPGSRRRRRPRTRGRRRPAASMNATICGTRLGRLRLRRRACRGRDRSVSSRYHSRRVARRAPRSRPARRRRSCR